MNERVTEQQWFQIALKTYFWVGFILAIVFAISLGCLAATKYYCDQAFVRYMEHERSYKVFASEMRQLSQFHYETDRMLREIRRMHRELNPKPIEPELGPFDADVSE